MSVNDRNSQLPSIWSNKSDKSEKLLKWILPVYPADGSVSVLEKGGEHQLEYASPENVKEARLQIELPGIYTENNPDFFREGLSDIWNIDVSVPEQPVENDEDTSIANSRIYDLASRLYRRIPLLQQVAASFKNAVHQAHSLPKSLTFWNSKLSKAEVAVLSRFGTSGVMRIRWHPKHLTMAATNGNSVVICVVDEHFRLENERTVTVLEHEAHGIIFDIVWNSHSKDTIAVCSGLGIAIWNIRSDLTKPVAVIRNSGCSTLAWISSTVLLLTDLCGSTRVWDALDAELDHNLRFADIHLMKASLDNSVIAYSTYGGYIGLLDPQEFGILWETKVGVVSSISWLPDNVGFIFSKKGQAGIWHCMIWTLHNAQYHLALKVPEVGRFELPEEETFEILDICANSSSTRAAIMFEINKLSPRCCLCATSLDESGTFTVDEVIGWITLEGNEIPADVDFTRSVRNSDVGILSILSISGTVSHVVVRANRKQRSFPRTPRLDMAEIQKISNTLSPIFKPFSALASYASWLLPPDGLENSYPANTLDAEISIYHPVGRKLKDDSTLVNESRSVGVSTFVENQAQFPERDRLEDFILNRAISRDSSERSSSEQRSDHHMSVDRTPDPAIWKARSRTQSPSSSPSTGSLSSRERSINGSYSKLRSAGAEETLVTSVLSIGKLTFAD